jgi:hypothetical protein
LVPLVQLFNQRYRKDLKPDVAITSLDDENFHLTDLNSLDETQLIELDKNYHQALMAWVQDADPGCTSCPSLAYFRDKVRRFGVNFATHDTSGKDSHISFRYDGDDEWHAGVILHIFSHTRESNSSDTTQTFAVVGAYEPLLSSDAKNDPYRMIPTASGRLFYNRMEPHKYLIPFTNIISHIGTVVQRPSDFHISKEIILAIPLSKVSLTCGFTHIRDSSFFLFDLRFESYKCTFDSPTSEALSIMTSDAFKFVL